MAVRADSFILAVNHLDEPEFIRDNIDTLRILGKGRTIALALSTLRRELTRSFGRSIVTTRPMDPADQRESVRLLEQTMQLPVISIMDENPQPLLNTVLGAYSGSNPAPGSHG